MTRYVLAAAVCECAYKDQHMCRRNDQSARQIAHEQQVEVFKVCALYEHNLQVVVAVKRY